MPDSSTHTHPSASSSVSTRKTEGAPETPPAGCVSSVKIEVVAILGVNPNPQGSAYKAQQTLAVKGHTPVPINPFFEEVDGLVCYPNLLSCPKKIDTVTVYVKPKILGDLLEDILDTMPRRVILNPGYECKGAEVVLRQAGIEVVKACTLLLLCRELF